MNFYQDLGFLVFGSRLKRLGDTFINDINRIYKDHKIPFDASWFPVFYILYETLLVSQWNGYTVGKKIMGIRVVSSSRKKVDWVQAFVRSISRVLSSLFLGLGYLWMLWDARSQTWHDKLADTYVVEA